MAREVAAARGMAVSELVRELLHAAYLEHKRLRPEKTRPRPAVRIKRETPR